MTADEKKTLTIAVMPGDGIGPELIESASAIMHAAAERTGLRVKTVEEPGGAALYRDTGENIAADAVERLSGVDALLKGPVGLPGIRKPDGTEAGLLGGVLRTGLDTYANVRPIRLLAGIQTPTRWEAGEIDYVIVRENTEGLYLSRGLGIGTRDAVVDQLLVTRRGVERVAVYAFELARARQGAPLDGVRRVTLVDKSNVLRSFAFFRSVTEEVAESYPDIELDYRYSDAAAHDLVMSPGHFDVVLTENFLGDLLSDLGAATVGGLGMCPSGNVGDGTSYFEPIHGSAPTIAGKNLANPLSQILSVAMMFRHLGAASTGALIEDAVTDACREGDVRINEKGSPADGTTAVTDALLRRILDR